MMISESLIIKDGHMGDTVHIFQYGSLLSTYTQKHESLERTRFKVRKSG